MLHFVYEWFILPPANLLAELLALLLGGLVPIGAGLVTGLGTFHFLQPHKQSYPRQWWGLVVGSSVLGVYFACVALYGLYALASGNL
jgi:hypothetical protein